MWEFIIYLFIYFFDKVGIHYYDYNVAFKM